MQAKRSNTCASSQLFFVDKQPPGERYRLELLKANYVYPIDGDIEAVKLVEGINKLKSHRYYTDIIGSYAKKHIVILKINEIIGLNKLPTKPRT